MGLTYSGYVGTVSPFTNELLAAGINEHRAVNIPIKAVVEVAPKAHSLKIVMKHIDEITPSMTSIDVSHYQITPFTAIKPIFFQDLTPIVLHRNTKVIKSMAKLKTFETTTGQDIGIDMTAKLDTETALYADGRPTARYHEHSLIFNPAKSVTKEAEVTVMVNIAEKKMGEEAHLIKINGPRIEKTALSSSTSHGMKLHESIKKVESESAHAVNIWLTAKLVGGNPQVYEYSVTAGKGATNMEHKWNF